MGSGAFAKKSGLSTGRWDWAADAALSSRDDTPDIPAWNQSPIWQDDFMGGNGDPNNDLLQRSIYTIWSIVGLTVLCSS